MKKSDQAKLPDHELAARKRRATIALVPKPEPRKPSQPKPELHVKHDPFLEVLPLRPDPEG